MPVEFEQCIAEKGSRKVTKKLSGAKYVHGCYSPSKKRWFWGEAKTAKESKE